MRFYARSAVLVYFCHYFMCLFPFHSFYCRFLAFVALILCWGYLAWHSIAGVLQAFGPQNVVFWVPLSSFPLATLGKSMHTYTRGCIYELG